MRTFSTKQKVGAAVLGAGVIAAALGGVAYAYWSSTGTGTGSALTGTTNPANVVVTQAAPPAGGLYPGMTTAITLSGKFNNSNSGPVKVGTVTAVLDTAHLPSGCIADDFTVGGSAPVNAEIPVGNDVGSWNGVTIIMNDTANNQDTCKAQTIPLIYTVSAAS